jgi:hypothetical protein
VARTGDAITGVELTLPATPPAIVTTTYHVHMPPTAMVDGCGWVEDLGVDQRSDPDERQHVRAGAVQSFQGADGLVETMSAWSGITPNYGYLSVRCALTQVSFGFREFDGAEHDVTVPEITALGTEGASLGDLQVTATAAEGFDFVDVHIGETGFTIPGWRVITPFDGDAAFALPALPTGITPADLGISDSTTVTVLLVAQGTVPDYAAPASNHPLPGNAIAVAPDYQEISSNGR